MKTIALSILVLIAGLNASAQIGFHEKTAQITSISIISLHHTMLYTASFAEEEFIGYRPPGFRQRNTGIVLASLGTVMFAASIPMLINAEAYYWTVNSRTGSDGDPLGAFGLIMATHGVAGIIAGSILWSKGNKKMKRHNNLNDVGWKFNFDPGKLSLNYTF